jgi:hypothetical protein
MKEYVHKLMLEILFINSTRNVWLVNVLKFKGNLIGGHSSCIKGCEDALKARGKAKKAFGSL